MEGDIYLPVKRDSVTVLALEKFIWNTHADNYIILNIFYLDLSVVKGLF